MKLTLSTLPVLLLTASLAAQGGLSTATGYAVHARIGPLSTPNDVQGVPAGTDITNSGLRIRAHAGSSTGAIPMATAATHARISPLSSSANVRTVLVDETGAAISTRTRPAIAGTSDDPRRGGQAPHGLAWVVPARPGTTGVVAVTWTASASIGAYQLAIVDVDGDGTPEFAQRVSNGNVQFSRSYRVRAGNRGFAIGIVTGAEAGANISTPTATGARYDGRLSVSLRIDPRCTFTNFGRECGGRLDGVLPGPTGSRFALDLTNAAPRAIAVLVIGPRMRTPIPLPGSHCVLHVDPIITLSGQTNGQGEKSWTFPSVAVAPTIHVSFQAVTLDLNGTPMLASSNGTTLICQ